MDKNKLLSYEDVAVEMKKYLSKKESFEVVKNAFDFASEKHAGQMRKSGEPYIDHLNNVAYILATLQAGPHTIAAGYLHDTIEDCGVTYDEIKNKFNDEIAYLVESVTKLKRLSQEASTEELQAQNHRKIFIAMAKDIRVIIIKLADRLHNMRTLSGHNNEEKEKRIAKETLDVYTPIAHRLGINTIKSELEDLSIKYLEPEKFRQIKMLLSTKEEARKQTLNLMQEKIEELLKRNNIQCYISGRVKSIYSIYKKMYIKGRSFDEIYDLQALRIICSNVTQCYEILGYIHAEYRPIPGRFKDYIAMPKPNLYQSLHTTIVAEDGQIFEIQIRTAEMDEIAEAGVAAHWRYKENVTYSSKQEQKEIEEQLHWFRDLIAISDDTDAKDYMEMLQKDIFEANVYCLTPKGRVIDLPAGSTPVDFAYKIHTGVGDATIGASVNGILVPLSTVLKTGDVVDIKTTKAKDPLPNEDWLKFVKSVSAKNHIKRALQKNDNELRKDEIIANGREQLEAAVRSDKAIDSKQFLKDIEEKKFLDEFNVESVVSLYVAIANHTLSTNQIISTYKQDAKKKIIVTPFKKKKNKGSIDGVIIPGIDNVAISFSQCCSPIPGDEIVGYISQGKDIKIHRKDCNTIHKGKSRLIDCSWDYDYIQEHPSLHYVDLSLQCASRSTLLQEIVNHLSLLKINCNSCNILVNPQLPVSTVRICIEVRDTKHLNEVINSLSSSLPNIYSVIRYQKN